MDDDKACYKAAWLQQQWQVLHQSFEQAERYSLLIKLFAVAICFFGAFVPAAYYLSLSLLVVLWLQDAIWKTFQARTEVYLLMLEQALQEAESNIDIELGFYRHFQQQRQGVLGLLKEYLSQMLRPTVMYPYPLLILLSFAHGLSY